MDKETILIQLRQFKKYESAKYPIEQIGLIGSHARGENNEKSDIDILLQFNSTLGCTYFDLANDLKKLFHLYKVGVVSKNAIPPLYWDVIKNDVLYA